VLAAVCAATVLGVSAGAATAAEAATTSGTTATTGATATATATAAAGPASAGGRACPPSGVAVGFSDALNKASVGGVEVGGLSGLAYDRRGGYVAVEDHSGNDPARLFFFTNPLHPRLTGSLALRAANGAPYNGSNFDGEGVAVLPDGDFLVSSETEPSVRIFDRAGTEVGSLPVPARFAVAPAGEATVNATLEGLSISPDGRYVYAAMEGTLSGDLPAGGGEGRYRRILVYVRSGNGYRPLKQIGYQVEPGNRIAEAQAYADGRLLILEAAFSAEVGNTVQVYAITGANRAPDVSGVANLSAAPAADIVAKRLVTDLVRCPTLGATSLEKQTNPLLDNFEGLAVAAPAGRGPAVLTFVSDDNFSATQRTRLLVVGAQLP
jgi:hypothetical protein